MALTREQEALLPADHEVAFYHEHGWYRSPRIIPDAVLDAAFIGVSRHFNGERDWILRRLSPPDAEGSLSGNCLPNSLISSATALSCQRACGL